MPVMGHAGHDSSLQITVSNLYRKKHTSRCLYCMYIFRLKAIETKGNGLEHNFYYPFRVEVCT